MKSPNDASTTKPATTLPMKAENEKPNAGRETQENHSAVMLGIRHEGTKENGKTLERRKQKHGDVEI